MITLVNKIQYFEDWTESQESGGVGLKIYAAPAIMVCGNNLLRYPMPLLWKG